MEFLNEEQRAGNRSMEDDDKQNRAKAERQLLELMLQKFLLLIRNLMEMLWRYNSEPAVRAVEVI